MEEECDEGGREEQTSSKWLRRAAIQNERHVWVRALQHEQLWIMGVCARMRGHMCLSGC